MFDYEKATQIIERDFNDDEDYLVSGSPPPSARLKSSSSRNRMDSRRSINPPRGQSFDFDDQLGSSRSREQGHRSADENKMFAENGGRNGSRSIGYDLRDNDRGGGRLDVGYGQRNGILSQSSFGDRLCDDLGRSLETARIDTRRASSPGNRGGWAEGNGRSTSYAPGQREMSSTSSNYFQKDTRPVVNEPSYRSGVGSRGRDSDFLPGNRDTNSINQNGRSTNDRWGSQSGGARMPPSRSTSKVVYDGEVDAKDRERNYFESTRLDSGRGGGGGRAEEKEFLGKVQRELEGQRREWKDEIDRLTSSSLMPGAQTTFDALKNSVVDTSSGRPIFKAFIDVSEFPPESIKVNVDKIANKVVVEAQQTARTGAAAKSFTQRVQLPRYADEQQLVARMNKRGILKVEVPLIYYFPESEQDDGSKARSFVYEVRTNPQDGSKVMEILVNTGREYSTRDLSIEMAEDDKLQIWAKKSLGSVGSLSPTDEDKRTLIKQYTMPANADVGAITTRRNKDGCLAILVPIY